MSEIAAIGERARIGMLALAGARIYPADTGAQVLSAWASLPPAVSVVVVTESAAAVIAGAEARAEPPLLVVMGPCPG